MQLSKNKKYQYLFFSILSIFIIFNGGNSNLFIQFNFILISFIFLFCLKDKNYNLHLKYFYINNKKSIFLYIIFLIIYFSNNTFTNKCFEIFSPEKYKFNIYDKYFFFKYKPFSIKFFFSNFKF